VGADTVMSLSKAFVFFSALSVSGFVVAEPDASSNGGNNAAHQKLLPPEKIKMAKIIAENSVDKLDMDQVTLLTLMSNLISVSEAELDINIRSLYTNLKENGAIKLNGEMARFAILLKAMVPALCQGGGGGSLPVDRDGKIVLFADFGVSYLFGLAETEDIRGLSIISDKITLDKNNSVSLTKELTPLLVMSKLVCDALNKRSLLVSEADLILNRAGYQSGSLVVMDPKNPGFDELSDFVGNPFGQTGAEYQQAADEATEQYEAHGYLEVADKKIKNLEETYQLFKNNYETLEQVTEKLSFFPSPKIDKQGFRFLGASEESSYTDSGYAGVASIYDSPLGKVAISEIDLVTSHTTIFVSPESLNTSIGGNPASMTVYKGEENNEYYSDIFWVDENTSRMFTVEVSLNLNAEAQQENKALLMGVLEKHYGAY